MIPQQKEAFEKFRQGAKENLGTEDFTITLLDIPVARTSDGWQYPSEEVVRAYYMNQLIFVARAIHR